jgi:glutaredoxin 3
MRVRLPVAFVSKEKTGAVKEEVKHNHAEGASMVHDVIVYSNMGCIPCHHAMEYLSQKGVPFIEKNVAREPSAMQDLMSMGLRVLPVIVIGDKRLSGFNPAEIDAALAGENNRAEAASL